MSSDNEAKDKLIKIMDKALSDYYKSLNTPYYDNDGDEAGLFAEFCDENGIYITYFLIVHHA